MSSIPIYEFIRDLELEPIYLGGRSEITFSTSDVNRPGLQFADYYDHFYDTSLRLQVVGMIEMTYLETLDPITREERLDEYFKHPLPCVIITREMNIPDEMLKKAKEYDCPLLRTKLITTRFVQIAIYYLNSKLAPSTTVHGELVDVYGIGVLIMGESGIGKSETTLELVKMGHRLVSDDSVEIKKVSEDRLVGESPDITQNFMEIRGIGIIDIKEMYGVGAIIKNKSIDLVINLEFWDEENTYERLGMDENFTTILGVNVPKLTIPVRPGRNLAIITEVAARNFRLKNMGYDAPLELDRRITEQM
jgi:HPr kinase/phosphorylase